MFSGVALPFATVLVAAGVGSSQAVPPSANKIDYLELVVRIILNQMEILKGMNECNSFLASHGDEVKLIRNDMEEWKSMNKTMMDGMKEINESIHNIPWMNVTLQLSEGLKNEMQRLHGREERKIRDVNETKEMIAYAMEYIAEKNRELAEQVNHRTDVINENIHRWMNEMKELQVAENDRVMQMLHDIQHTIADHNLRPDPGALASAHNGSETSLCNGTKALFGAHGYLKLMGSGNYTNNMQCKWTVTLPEGTRPVFHWHYFNIEQCTHCGCDYIYIHDADHPRVFRYCGNNPPDGSALTIMNNRFIVGFRADGSVVGGGFRLQYHAVEMN